MLRETTSRGLCGLVCLSRTSARGEKGDSVKEGGGKEGERERERALERLDATAQVNDCVNLLRYRVCVFYYCRTYYKAVRVGGGGEWRTCAMRDDEFLTGPISKVLQ